MLTIFKSFWTVYKHQPFLFIFIILSKLIQGFFPLLSILILQKLINSVQLFFETRSTLTEISYLLGLQILLTIISNILLKVDEYSALYLQMKLELSIKGKISEKIIGVSYEKLEDHEFYNLIQRTQGDLGSQFMNPINNVLEIGRSLIVITTVLIFLIQFHILFLVILIAFAIPLLLLQNKFGKNRYWLTKYLTPSAREQGYIFSLFVDRKYNKEIRLNQSFNYLFDKWKSSYRNNTDEVLKQHLNQNKKLIGLDILSSLTFATSFFLILFLLSKSVIRIGDFVSVLEAIQRVLGVIHGLSYVTSNLKENTYYLKDVFAILDMPSRHKNINNVSVNSDTILEINNLDFKYPFSENKVLNNINLKMNKGDNIIIVGSNGSGKSTLIKCLIGLYEIPNNKINLFGKDINLLTEEEIYGKVSVIYQDFGTYEMTAYQNILLGDTTQGEKAIVEAAKKAETDEFINSLFNRYETKLGRLFEGSKDLSGGQWQKLALARAMLKDSELIIFDEPTSSLDSIAEKKLFLKFKDITEGKTSIYISHRMYACHLADYIIVLKEGQIVETGNHLELIKKEGHYKELYNNQSDMYKTGEVEMSYGNV